MQVRISPSWQDQLAAEFVKPYFDNLVAFVKQEYLQAKVYPPGKDIFRAFDLCDFDKTKVVIVGQDPYHGTGQANGLAFAVHKGVAVPPSLKNIYKEIASDLGVEMPSHGDLSGWARQGVMLLNATLTVRAASPGSHQGHGWEQFTDEVITRLNEEKEHLVFLLWGKYAQNKGAHIDAQKHLVLNAAHPSPYSANSGFFGSRHFSKTNAYLARHGIKEIDWQLLD